MRVERRIFLNTAVLGAGEAVGQLANFAFVVMLARRYGVEVLGWYAFAMALGAVLAPFVSLGAATYVTREIARSNDRAGALLAALRPVQVSSGLVVWLVMAVVAVLADIGRRETAVVVAVGAYHVLMRMTVLYLAPAVARERALGTALVGGGHRVLMVALAGSAMLLGFDAPVAVLAMPVAAVLSLLAARLMAGRDLAQPVAAGAPVNRSEVLIGSLPFLGTALLAVAYSRGGVLLLTGLRGEVATGEFAAADRLLVPILMVTGTFTAALFAPLSRLAAEPDRMRELSGRCLRLVLLVTIPMTAALTIFADDIVALLFGTSLQGAAPILMVLAPLAVLRSVSALWTSQCMALGEERRVTIARTWVVLVFFVLASCSIGIWGAMGLAVASILSESVMALWLRRLLAEHSSPQPAWRMARASLVAAVCAGAVAMLLPAVALPVRAVLVAAIMVLVTVVLGGVRAHDLGFLIAILRKRVER
jgi:O-antigen/teichoic acid export membrane protein